MTGNKTVREALEFYANEKHISDCFSLDGYYEVVERGDTAKEALAALDRIEAVETVTDEMVEKFCSLYIDEWNDKLVFRNEYQIGITSDTKRYERERVRKVLKEVLK